MAAESAWSVKGIDPKAREIAKDQARRSGVTLGEWLNQMIIEGDQPAPPTPHGNHPQGQGEDHGTKVSEESKIRKIFGETAGALNTYLVGRETDGRERASPQLDQILPYIDLYQAQPVERIHLIRRGMPASAAKQLVDELALGQGRGFGALNLSTATVNRKAADDAVLGPEESERVLGLARLVGQLQTMAAESGNLDAFDVAGWLSRWLQEPVAALGGVRPLDLLDTMEGQALVSNTLQKAQSGAYA